MERTASAVCLLLSIVSTISRYFLFNSNKNFTYVESISNFTSDFALREIKKFSPISFFLTSPLKLILLTLHFFKPSPPLDFMSLQGPSSPPSSSIILSLSLAWTPQFCHPLDHPKGLSLSFCFSVYTAPLELHIHL